MKKAANDIQLEHDLRRLSQELELNYGVQRIGYFYEYTRTNGLKKPEVNIIVELKRPMGWKFFEMKEHLERKLFRRIDVVTPAGLKALYKPEILRCVQWL